MPMGTRSITILTIALAAILSGTSGCAEHEPQPAAEVARPVKTLRIANGDTGAMLEYPGKVAAKQQAEMAFEIPGRIVEFPVTEGQAVKEGDILARLDTRDAQAAYDAEIAKRRAAQANYDRMKKLFEQGIASRKELDDVTRNLEVINANARVAQKRVDDTVLVAPFAGRVARKLVDDFANVQAKQAVVLLQDQGRLEVKVTIPENDLRFSDTSLPQEERMRQLQPLVELSTFPGRKLPGRITEISTAADPVTRTFTATVSFDPTADITVLPGMTAKVSVQRQINGKAADPSVPAAAVLGGADGTPFVWKIDPQTMRVHRTPVEVGMMGGDGIAVKSGLNAGDEIAISGVSLLREDMLVRRLTN